MLPELPPDECGCSPPPTANPPPQTSLLWVTQTGIWVPFHTGDFSPFHLPSSLVLTLHRFSPPSTQFTQKKGIAVIVS